MFYELSKLFNLIYYRFKRPIYLGIYGHPSNDIARYKLDIIQNSEPGEEFNLNLFESVEENETLTLNDNQENDVRINCIKLNVVVQKKYNFVPIFLLIK